MKIGFGKHQGAEIEDLPSDYLRWLAVNCDEDEVATAADEEHRWRDDHDAHWHGD